MRLLVLPRDDSPYQKLLYAEMEKCGIRISYIGELTPSKTLNVFLLPFETAFARLGGVRLVHIHWVFVFALPWASRFAFLRRVAQVWFHLWLRECRLLGMYLVWTVHNVLPHQPVFTDDIRARRALVQASALLVAHSEVALDELVTLGAVAKRTAIIQHGPIGPTLPAKSLRVPGSGDGPRQFLFLGRVQEYKGVEDLLRAFTVLPSGVAAQLLVAGQCDDRVLEGRLRDLAGMSGGRGTLRLEYIPEDEITELLAAADVVVLPFRRITTSGSAVLALSHGRPLIVPSLSSLVQLPDDAVLRYGGEDRALAEAITHLAQVDGSRLVALSTAAFKYSASLSWREIAERTTVEMRSLLDNSSHVGTSCGPVRSP